VQTPEAHAHALLALLPHGSVRGVKTKLYD